MTADSPQLAEIRRVLDAHAPALMEIPGVVGVAVGLLGDRATPCIRVLVERRTPGIEELPSTLEGHPLVVEETGPFRPLDGR